MRAVRTLLEVSLHRGTTTTADAAGTLHEEVGLSVAAAGAEIRRFVVLPGHAPSYFAGGARASELRTEIELALGRRFRGRAYHDFLLAQGSMPFALLRRRACSGFVSTEPLPLFEHFACLEPLHSDPKRGQKLEKTTDQAVG